ncbi:putative poly(glycerol-phosphate) alpha-glucosyltransferase [Pedobacter glucosidilyticus]|nr:putative poly(glycerol-phosphate) alpha-glucosyltransferase [Pedobacter glucosidilyticus]
MLISFLNLPLPDIEQFFMRIAILAPSDKSFIKDFLPTEDFEKLPLGYSGAPFIGTIIKELLKLNHTVTAITTSKVVENDYHVKKFQYKNFTWVVVPSRPHAIKMNGNKLGRILDFFEFEQKYILSSLIESSPDIVHAHWSYEFAGAAIKSGLPSLVTIHDNPFIIFRYFKNIYRLGRLLMAVNILRKVIHASTVSPYMLKYARKRCKEVKIIPNPVEPRFSNEQIKKLVDIKINALNAPKIIMINNGWDKRKNGKSALLAFKILQQQHPKATLHLFGGGSELDGLANKEANLLGLKNVFFYGTVSHDKIINELEDAHLFLHTALEESFGVVLIEAMSFGVPVVGGEDSGAVPWVINQKELLVDVTNPKVIAQKIFELINDSSLYKKLSLMCFQNVLSRFSSSFVTKEYLSYYQYILSASIQKDVN